MECNWHLCKKPLSGRQTKWCSRSCQMKDAITRWRRDLKARCVAYKGGRCESCGYDKSVSALQFHHPENNKEFSISQAGNTRSWDRVRQELDKCVMLCANCHAEAHYYVPV